MVGLEDLVPDVLYVLLLKAPNMHILWCYIRASPRMYQVFRDHRDLILSTAITREIGTEMLNQALSALDSSYFESRGLRKPQAVEWIKKHQDSLTMSSNSPTNLPISTILPLWQMHRDVEFLTNLYVETTLSKLEGKQSTTGTVTTRLDELSNTERMRIYRAIYRYAIYGNLFHFDQERHTKRSQAQLASAHDQSHMFLSLFPAWQVEELSCINDFMHDQILEKWQEMEDHFYDSLKDTPSSWDLDKKPYWSRWEDDFFSHAYKRSWYETWQRYFATLSLTQLRDYFAAHGESLMQMTQKYAGRWPNDFLTGALDESPYHSSMYTQEFEAHEEALTNGVKIQFERDDIGKPNEGWLWAHDYLSCELYVDSTFDFPIGKGLRRFGYVFWDSKRLRDARILQNPSV